MAMKVLGIAVSVLLLSAGVCAEPSAPIVGQYLEARSGHVHTCGCLFSGEQVTEGKEAILAWAFRGGEYQGTSLANLSVAAVVVGDAHLALESTPRKSVIFLDSSASDAQRQAALGLLREKFGKILGDIQAVHVAPVEFQSDGDKMTVSLGGVGTVVGRKAQLPEDAHPGSRTWYGPFIPMADSTLSTTLVYQYEGHDFSRQWQNDNYGITGYMGTFALVP
jgi:hypothetical protein